MMPMVSIEDGDEADTDDDNAHGDNGKANATHHAKPVYTAAVTHPTLHNKTNTQCDNIAKETPCTIP